MALFYTIKVRIKGSQLCKRGSRSVREIWTFHPRRAGGLSKSEETPGWNLVFSLAKQADLARVAGGIVCARAKFSG